jgi:predicted nucleic acid-binding protein
VKQRRASEVVEAAAGSGAYVTLQALGEVFAVLTRRRHWASPDARIVVSKFAESMIVITPTLPSLERAMRLCEVHRLSFWDSQMICVAAQGGCELLVSEDLQDGRRFVPADVGRSLTVCNPFDDANSDTLRKHGLLPRSN